MVQLAVAAFFLSAPHCSAVTTNHFSQLMYCGCVLGYSWVTLGNWLEGRKRGALKPDVSPADFLRLRNRILRSCAAISAVFLLVVVDMLAG